MTSLSIHHVTKIRLCEIKSVPNLYGHGYGPFVFRTIEITHGAEKGREQVTTVSLHSLESKEEYLQVLPLPEVAPTTPVAALPLPEAA